MAYQCKLCNFTTENKKILANHVRWNHYYAEGSEERDQFKKQMSIKASRVPRIEYEIICPECNKKFTVCVTEAEYKRGAYRHYCSKSCANKQGSKHVDYSKVSSWAKENPTGWASIDYIATGSRVNHSKRELEIVDFLKSNFPDDEWKVGFVPNALFNGSRINPDIHSNKLKIIIEYDGIWHFKDITGQLLKKQQLDRDTLQWCQIYNYRLIRIDEDLKISNDEIVNAIYNSNNKLELFNSSRYDYLFKSN